MNIKDKIDIYWENDAKRFDDILNKKKNLSFAYFVTKFQEKRMKKILKMINIKENDKAIDIGCGGGVYLLELARKGALVTGVDYSEKMINIAKSRLKGNKIKNFKLFLCDGKKIKVKNNSYDFFISIGLLDYVNNVEEYIKEMNRILKRGGKGIICIPSKYSPYFFLRTKFGNWIRERLLKSPPILNYLSKSECIEVIKKNNFRILSYDQVYLTMHIFLVEGE